jgi:hypothetical protein
MSYDLDLYFRSPEFPDKEWTEILSWFDAIERTVELDDLERYHGLRKNGLDTAFFTLCTNAILA